MSGDQLVSVLFVLGIILSVVSGLVVAPVGSVVAQDATECEFPLTVEDGTGTEVTIEEPPENIVVTHASSAQVVHHLDAWDSVTGAPVTPFTAYLDDHDQPDDVTDDEGWPIQEEIVNLEPDLVLVGHLGDPADVETLRDQGLNVYMGPVPESVEAIKEKVERYGQLIDACEEADAEVEWMSNQLDDIDERADELDEPLVYYELGEGYTAGTGTFQADLIERAGAENLGSTAGVEGWGVVSEETVVDLDPEWIVYGDSFEEPPITQAIESTTAFERNQTLAVNSNYMSQAGPRVVLAIEEMNKAFVESTQEVEDDDTATTDDVIPGFGVPVAVVALALALLFRR